MSRVEVSNPDPVVVQSLTKVFKRSDKPALNDVSLVVAHGQVTGIVGPDGAGKTTLIRHIIGLMHGDSGSVTVFGFDHKTEAHAISKTIGYMPQKFGLYEELTVIENLTFYADLQRVPSGERKAKFEQLLSFTSLDKFQSRLAGKLSGGMKQKLGLACALVSSPKLLVLDEPSVGVDPISRRELWSMVQQLLSTNMAVIWSTAYLDEAEKCSRVLLLNEGVNLYEGKPENLLEQVRGRTWQIRGIPAENRRQVLMSMLKEKGVVDGVIQGMNIRIVMDGTTPKPHLNIGEWHEVDPWLEDAFINILQGVNKRNSYLGENMPSLAQKDDTPVIDARGLTKHFDNFVAVQNNTFKIKRGEIFGLLGPNGAGKSTTFKMMCGLLQPTEGEAFVAGISLQKATSEARSRIGYMAQKFSLYGNLTLLQNLKLFAGLYGLSREQKKYQIPLMIDTFSFQSKMNMDAKDLPLGFKQRLALACSVMHQPDVLFLDEPTSGVDPITRREFWMHINSMVEKGVTVMVTTHFMDEAEYCDRIGLIYNSKNIATGTPDDLKNMATNINPTLQTPTLEDAFIALVEHSDRQT